MELVRLPKIKVNSAAQSPSEDDVEAPITGQEIREACNRHTVYKIYVHYQEKQGWFVYRRYREFYKLRADLKKLFPAKEFTLPPKRYFGDNFEPRFLNSRRQGLQGFLYMITRQKDVQKSAPVTEFLALNNPPGALDDLEQCRAVIEQLEATVDKLRTEKSDHETNLSSSNGQIVELHEQKQAVLAALRYERQQNGRKHYPGDDLSLMFEYRSLPEVCRVDVSSFLVRKPPAYLARKFENKTRKDDTRAPRDQDGSARARALTPPLTERGRHKDSARKSQPLIEIQSPNAKDSLKQFRSTDSVASPRNGEFKSFYEFSQRRKSMPGAVEFHRVNNILKAANHVKNGGIAQKQTSLAVPDVNRPRSYSATPPLPEEVDAAGSHNFHPAVSRVRRQMSLENPKKTTFGWSSLKDLRKLKGKAS